MDIIKEEKNGCDNDIPLVGLEPEPHVRNFEEEIDCLRQFVPRVFHLYHWFGATRRDEQLCTIEYLGNMLCRSLTSVRRLLQLRSQRMCDEHCREFEGMLHEINGIMISIEKFVEKAENLFHHEFGNHERLTTLVSRSREDVGWLAMLSRNDRLAEIIHHKCERMNFLLNTRLMMLPTQGFRQMSYAVMFGLMILTLPSHGMANDPTIIKLYQNSIDAYRRSDEGTQEVNGLEEVLKEEFQLKHIQTREQEITALTEQKISLKSEIRNFLTQFNISYNITLDERSVGILARKLYVQLNCTDSKKGKHMTDDDLTHYMTLYVKLQYLQERIDELKRIDNEGPVPPDPDGYFAAQTPRQRVRRAIESTLRERKGDHCHVLSAQAHWLAVFRVLEEKDLARGTMKQFADLMCTEGWFPEADPPCNYKSMKSVPAIDVKLKPYAQWDPKADRRNAPYKLVADTLVRYLGEQDLIE